MQRHLLLALCLLMSSQAFAKERLRFFSFHGGGIDALAAVYFLKALQKDDPRPFHERIDGAAGSSAGAILAAALCASREPRFTDPDFPDAFVRHARKIMSWSTLIDRRADAALKGALIEEFGQAYLSQSACHLMIPAFDRGQKRFEVFDSVMAQDADFDLPVWQAVRASGSLDFPWFGPMSSGEVRFNTTRTQEALSDPGLHGHNDPTEFLVERIKAVYPGQEAVIYSLGTGEGVNEVRQMGPIRVVRIEPHVRCESGAWWSPIQRLWQKIEPKDEYLAAIKARALMCMQTPEFIEMQADFQSTVADYE